MDMLEQLLAVAREDVERRSREVSIASLERQLGGRGRERPFSEALVRSGISVVAEFKRRSPSSGQIRDRADVADVVAAYERGGAAALSVLTEERHFGGSLEDLRAARQASSLPILRKDFTVDRYQLYEAAASGADAVLLIVAGLDDAELAKLFTEATSLDLDCLVEVHDKADLDRALQIDADVLGINNRDLSDFSVDVETTRELITDIPAGKTVISESGIGSREQVDALEEIGIDGVLVGENLMRAEDPEQAVRDLTGAEEITREHPV